MMTFDEAKMLGEHVLLCRQVWSVDWHIDELPELREDLHRDGLSEEQIEIVLKGCWVWREASPPNEERR
jgi:hypothetical protein